MTIEMEALADKICKEELGQEPNENNLSFRKTLVHGMVRWNDETKVKKISSNTATFTRFDLERAHITGWNNIDFEDWFREHFR